MNEEQLVIVPIPPLITLLIHHEKQKGSPLTEAEVLSIRSGAICMTMRASIAAQMAEKRGYHDVRPEHVWEDWNAIRPSLTL